MCKWALTLGKESCCVEETPRKNNTRRGNRQNDPRKIGIWSESFQCEKGLLCSTNLGHEFSLFFQPRSSTFSPSNSGTIVLRKKRSFFGFNSWPFQCTTVSSHSKFSYYYFGIMSTGGTVSFCHLRTIVYYHIPAASVVLAVQVSFLTRTLLAQRNTSQNPR